MKKLLLSFGLFLVTGAAVFAQAPQAFNYQGVARSVAGSPLASTAIGLRLTIHDGSAGGTVVYRETQTPTTNSFGLYNVAVGNGTAIVGTFSTINWGSGNKYMEVEIDPAGGSSYTSVGSSQLLSVPYAMYAANSTGGTVTSINTSAPLTGGPITSSGTIGLSTSGVTAGSYGSSTQVAQIAVDAYGRVTSASNVTIPAGVTGSGTTNYVSKFTSATALGNSQIFDNGTALGLFTATPTTMAKVHVSGVGSYGSLPYYQAGLVADGGGASANASGVYGEGGWRGVYGRNPGTASGTEAMGVLGRVEGSAYTGTGYGVKGENAGTGGTANYGVYGGATGGTNINVGVYGLGGNMGTYGRANGAGLIYTLSLVALTPGVVGQVRTVTSGFPTGIYGMSQNNTSFGQAGIIGIGDSNASINYGLYAKATHGLGTATNYGVYGTTDGSGVTNYAGYFSGNLYAVSASSSIKSFKIDHPSDPANKYLYHSSVESNDMMNLYNGNVVTDANGDATIALPSYFTTLNKDYKYQLTVIGQFAQAIIAEKVTGNQFKIKTDKPNVEVSWLVAGVRQDPAANAYRIQAEVDKPASEKGTYLMPEVYGKGREMETGYKNSPSDTRNNPAGVKQFPADVPATPSGDNTTK